MRRPPDKNGQPALSERDVDSSNATLNTLFGGSRQKSWMISPGAPVRPSPRRAGLSSTQGQPLANGQSATGAALPASLASDELYLPPLSSSRESPRYAPRELRTQLSSPEVEIQSTQAEAFHDRHLPPPSGDNQQVEALSGSGSRLQFNDMSSPTHPNVEHQLQPTSTEPLLHLQPQNTTYHPLPPSTLQPSASSNWTVAELRSPSPLEPDAEDVQSASLTQHLAQSLNSDSSALLPVDSQMQNSASVEPGNLQVAMDVEQLPFLDTSRHNPHKRQRTNIANLRPFKSKVSEILDHIGAVGGTENLNAGLERPRFQLLQEACNTEDDFYIALHQVFCAWSCDRAQVIGISDFPPVGILHFAFKVLGQLIRDNGQLAPVHLKFFARFPNPLPEILKTSEQYCRSVNNAGRFLTKLANEWIPFSRECSSRGYPPLVDELITRLLVLSPILQGVMFTATRRNLGMIHESVGARLEEIHQKDRHDHQILSARTETAQPPTQREIHDRNKIIIDAYRRLLNHAFHHRQSSSSSQSRIPPSSASEDVNMQASFSPANEPLPFAQANIPRQVSSNNGSGAAPDGSGQAIDGRQQSTTTSFRSPGPGAISVNRHSDVNDHRLHLPQPSNIALMRTVPRHPPHVNIQSQPVLRSNVAVHEQIQPPENLRTSDPHVIHHQNNLDENISGRGTLDRSRPAETSHIEQHGRNAIEPGMADQNSLVHSHSVHGPHGPHTFAPHQPNQANIRYPSELQQATNQQQQQHQQYQQNLPPHLQQQQQQHQQHHLQNYQFMVSVQQQQQQQQRQQLEQRMLHQLQQRQQEQQPHQLPQQYQQLEQRMIHQLQQRQQEQHQHQRQHQQNRVPAGNFEVHQDNTTSPRVSPLVYGEPENTRRGPTVANTLNYAVSHRRSIDRNSPSQNLSRVHLVPNTDNAMSHTGNQSHTQRMSTTAPSNAVMSPALSDQAKLYSMTSPMQRNIIPPSGFVHPVQPTNPRSTALHQAHLRSPRLVAQNDLPHGVSVNEPGNRYYQVVKGFVRDPSYLSGSESVFPYDFSIPEADYRSIAQDESAITGDVPKRIFTTRTMQYRLRCVKRPKKELTCTVADWVVSDTRWPEYGSLNISFGRSKYQLEMRRKTHHGKDLPIDLTSYLRLVGFNTKTRVTLAVPGRRLKLKESSYFLAIEAIEILRHNDIVDTCLESQHRSASETLDAIKKSLAGGNLEDDDDIAMVTTDLSIELADPFTARIFDIPVRGNSCLHRECFDLDTFLLTRNSKPGRQGQPSMIDVWRCPLCGRDARPASLHIDDFLVGVRNELKDRDMLDVKAIVIDQNGEWRPKEEEKTGTGKRKATNDASDSEDDDPKRGNVLHGIAEIIDLDDD